jgi:N-terminal region of Chorein or VPS13
MDLFLSRITDIGLRRLYKFILKRSIGAYLNSELLIEQLSVSSRTGLVTLTDIQLNCDLLNDEYLKSSPFRLSSFVIPSLEVVISYTSVLHDGCRFRASHIEILLESGSPRTSKLEKKSNLDNDIEEDEAVNILGVSIATPAAAANFTAPSNVSGLPASAEGEEGLNFIANWIEVVLARLQVSVENVKIRLNGSTPSSSTSAVHATATATVAAPAPFMEIQLSKATFYNTNPRTMSYREGTVASSVRLAQSQSYSYSHWQPPGEDQRPLDQSGLVSARSIQLGSNKKVHSETRIHYIVIPLLQLATSFSDTCSLFEINTSPVHRITSPD